MHPMRDATTRRLATALLASGLVLATALPAIACPLCKDTIANTGAAGNPNGGGPGLPSGFNTSIYYMLGGLFAVLATGGYFVVRTIRTTDAAAAQRGFDVRHAAARA
jgi:hypothetical protein